MSERQPTRSKRVVADRRFDKTQLRASGHGRVVHRDYAAHVLRWMFVASEVAAANNEEVLPYTGYIYSPFLRWGWVARQVKQHMKILDVGCGQDQPLLYILGNRMQTVPDLYVGVDLNRLTKKSAVKWSVIYDEFDFVTKGQQIIEKYGPFDIVTNFEVIEHMAPEDGLVMVERFYDALKPGGVAYISTPVFDGMAAANHVHEYTIPELQELIDKAGFIIERRIGTFASKPAIVHAMKKKDDKAGLEVYNRLEKWFGGDVMACVMASEYPDDSRNNLWILRKPSEVAPV